MIGSLEIVRDSSLAHAGARVGVIAAGTAVRAALDGWIGGRIAVWR